MSAQLLVRAFAQFWRAGAWKVFRTTSNWRAPKNQFAQPAQRDHPGQALPRKIFLFLFFGKYD
jgi:hypothetical protein